MSVAVDIKEILERHAAQQQEYQTPKFVRLVYFVGVVCVTFMLVFMMINGYRAANLCVKTYDKDYNGIDVASYAGTFWKKIKNIAVVDSLSTVVIIVLPFILYGLWHDYPVGMLISCYISSICTLMFVTGGYQEWLKMAYNSADELDYAVYDSFDPTFMDFVRFQISGYMVVNFLFGACGLVVVVCGVYIAEREK